ncbi:hypothetical protein LguiA_034308 [Lonicera macranthoides]
MASASFRAPVARQSEHILASDPSINFYLGAFRNGATDDNPSLALTLYEDPWKIKKVLTPCDLDWSCQLLLSTKAVEEHVLTSMGENDAQLCRTGSGKELEVWDADESCGHKLFLKKWDNTDYFVLSGMWKRNFGADFALGNTSSNVVNQQVQKHANSPRLLQSNPSKRSKEELMRGPQDLSTSRQPKNGRAVA